MILTIFKAIFTIIFIFILNKWIIYPIYLNFFYKRQGIIILTSFPILGIYNIFKNLSNKQIVFIHHRKIYKKYINLRAYFEYIFHFEYIFLVDPELIKEFLQNPHVWRKDRRFEELFGEMFGKDNIFFNNEIEWKKSRKMFSKGFQFENLKINIKTIKEVANEIFEEELDKNLNNVDLMNIFQVIAGTIVVRLFFTKELSKRKFENLPIPNFLALGVHNFGNWIKHFSMIIFGAKLGIKISKEKREFVNRFREFEKFLINILKETLETKDYEDWKETNPFLYHLKKELEKMPEITYERLYSEIIVLFIAGTDTTGHLIHNILYFIEGYPDKYKKLKEEINENVKNIDDINFEVLKNKLPYLNCFIKETFRLKTPVLGVFPRINTSNSDYKIKDLTIKKNTRIQINLYEMFHYEKYFENPEDFIPERWLDGKLDNLDPFIFIPFGAGPKTCIGQHLSMLETKIVLIMFLLRYDFKSINRNEVSWTNSLLYETTPPILFNVKKK